MTFKVLTLNIHKGFSAGNRRFTLEAIRTRLRESGSNIVFLQEVIGENDSLKAKIDGWPENNQFEFLADSVWDHFAYGKNAITQKGHHGNAILSELPFTSWNNLDLSTSRFSQRGLLHGTLQNGMHMLCVHLGLLSSERREQTDLIVSYINQEIPPAEPLILAGDFNDWTGKVHTRLERECDLQEVHQLCTGKLAKTFPGFLPLLPMDRIYIRHLSPVDSSVMNEPSWREISDHCALVTELKENSVLPSREGVVAW